MGLKRAANFFARSSLYGWTGSAFTLLDAKGALQPYDRFVSEREFGLKRRMLLVNPDTPIPAQYTVIRIGASGPVFMVGWINQDLYDESAYSLIYLLHLGTELGNLVEIRKTKAASGMNATTQDYSLGTWYCNTERVTFSNSTEFTQNRITDSTITLPSTCPATADHEVIVGSKRYVLQEVYKTSGFVQARAQVKNV